MVVLLSELCFVDWLMVVGLIKDQRSSAPAYISGEPHESAPGDALPLRPYSYGMLRVYFIVILLLIGAKQREANIFNKNL